MMAQETPTGLKPSADILGYETSPELQYFSSQLAKQYDEKNIPLGETIIKGINPQADSDSRMQAAEAIKKASGTDQPQWINAIQSALNMNPRDLMISINGGANVPSQAYDVAGNKWTKVFNERKTAQNPLGEVRYYVDSNGKQYSPEEAEKTTGGPIVSLKEIPLTQQNFYKAKGILAEKAAQTQAEEWNRNQKLGAVATLNAPVIVDTSEQLAPLYKEILPYSLDPKTRELLNGIGEMRTGSQKMYKSASDKLKEIVKGNSAVKNAEDLKNQTGGITFGFNLNEKKQLVNSDGTTATTSDIDKAVENEQRSSLSDNSVTARKNDLLNRAQLLAAKGDLKVIDAMQMVINLEYQKALAINKIEQAGGIGIAKPTLPNEVGDSFSLAYVKNHINKDYGIMAKMFGDQVNALRQSSPNTTPSVGQIESLVSSNPNVAQMMRQSPQEIKAFLKEAAPILDQIKAQDAATVTNQPNVATPVAPRANAQIPNTPAGAKAPPTQTTIPATKTEKPVLKSLSSIFGSK
jgi:hypothetical protein